MAKANEIVRNLNLAFESAWCWNGFGARCLFVGGRTTVSTVSQTMPPGFIFNFGYLVGNTVGPPGRGAAPGRKA